MTATEFDPTEQLMDRARELVAELRHLRLKSDADDNTINLLKHQYDEISDRLATIQAKHEAREHQLIRERDQARVAYIEIEGILHRAGGNLTEALRARIGDKTPEEIPDRLISPVADDRLPTLSMN